MRRGFVDARRLPLRSGQGLVGMLPARAHVWLAKFVNGLNGFRGVADRIYLQEFRADNTLV
jgi:hypothetical protein